MGKISLTFVIFTLLFGLMTADQTTSFDYSQHGKDWQTSCQATHQSPVVLERTASASDKQSYLFSDFRPVQGKAHIYNTTILITPPSDDVWFGQIYTMTIKGDNYPFKVTEVRIRTKSEHKIKQQNNQEKQYDLQVQLSAKALYGNWNDKLNIGLLFEVQQTSSDPFLAAIATNNKKIDESFDLQVDLSHLMSREKLFNFWFYQGSVTFPPCTKNRHWIIPDEIFKMSKAEFDYFQGLYHTDKQDGNFRQIQSSEGNTVVYASFLEPHVGTEF